MIWQLEYEPGILSIGEMAPYILAEDTKDANLVDSGEILAKGIEIGIASLELLIAIPPQPGPTSLVSQKVC